MKKSVVFITKSLCYHQVYLADELYKIYGDDFTFIQMREPLDFRVAAHQEGFERSYLKGWARSEEERKICISILKNADVIIMGEVPYKITKYFNKRALLLRYSERLFKPTHHHYSFAKKCKQRLRYFLESLFPRCKNQVLLSTGAYTPLDYLKMKPLKKRWYKWGYFPSFEKYDVDSLLQIKKENTALNIVWVSRLISMKNPESAIKLAVFLKENGIDFKMHIVGDGDEKEGELKQSILNSISSNSLDKMVICHGKVESEKVKAFYQKADIALFTSSFDDGWGVGVNEAMNAGCAVLCSHGVGSSQYLIKNYFNGVIYQFKNDQDMFSKALYLIKNKVERLNISKNAYLTIVQEWNYVEAAKRLSILIEKLFGGEETPFETGPCSLAPLLKEEFYE